MASPVSTWLAEAARTQHIIQRACGWRPCADTKAALFALLATIAAAVMFAVTSAALEPLGMPALALPFVLVVWLFVLASAHFPILRAEIAAGDRLPKRG